MATDKNISLWAGDILFAAAGLLTIIHVQLYGEVLHLFYVLVVALFFMVLSIFTISVIRKNNSLAKGRSPLLITLLMYILVISWLGAIRTYPEYKEVQAFLDSRSELTFELGVQRKDARWKIARLYMNAPTSLGKIEGEINHKGTMIMHWLLMDKIKKGNGGEFKDDMYELAEVAFPFGKEFSRSWYERAYEHGRVDAIERYEERMLSVNPRYKSETANLPRKP